MIIATTGKIGSGKDTVADILLNLIDAVKINISDIVREEAIENGINLDRESLTKFTEDQLKAFGDDYYIDKTIKKIKSLKEEHIIVSGIRSPRNVARMREVFGKSFVLIAVKADQEIRYKRINQRKSIKDNITFDTFKLHDAVQEEVFQISETIEMADITLENNGDVSEINTKLKKILQELNFTL